MKEATDWLLIYQQPQSRLLENWEKTSKVRLNFIHHGTDKDGSKISLQEIVSKWPRYKDKNGDVLVSAKSFYCAGPFQKVTVIKIY